MTRIAVATPDRDRCGVADYARQLAKALPDRFDLSMVAYPESDSRGAWQRAAAEARDAELVHIHYEYSLFGVVKPLRNRFATFLRGLRAPSVVTLHDLLPHLSARWSASEGYRVRDALRDLAYLPFLSSWERRQYRRASHYVVHSRGHEAAVAGYVGEQRVSRIEHPVITTPVQWCGLNGPNRQARLVTPGFVKAHKGYGDFLRTLDRVPKVQWTVAGGPQDDHDRRYIEEFTDQIRERGLTSRTEVTNYLPREQLERATTEATVAVFPYQRSNGSGSVAWAIALGMPVMTTDIPVFNELIEAGAGIAVLPRAEPDSWSERIRELLGSPNQLETLAAANRDFAVRHSFASAGEWHGQLFDRLAAK